MHFGYNSPQHMHLRLAKPFIGELKNLSPYFKISCSTPTGDDRSSLSSSSYGFVPLVWKRFSQAIR